MTKEEWKAIVSKDGNFDGKFFWASKTARVFCRPSCNCKRCKPENIVIFKTLAEAAERGCRPCPKCRPDIEGWRGVKGELAENAKKIIEESYQEKFSLERIAEQLHVNKSYLARTFKEINHNTMLGFHNYCRCENAKRYLEDQEFNIEMVAYKVGYATPSHFARTFKSIFGFTPMQYRKSYFQELEKMI